MISQKTQRSLKHKQIRTENMINLPMLMNNVDLIPHMANFFVLRYLPERCIVFTEARAVSFYRHLVRWMANRRFVNLDLSMALVPDSTPSKRKK